MNWADWAMISRLKHKLDLPQIVPRPPCPPKVYKKLYQYLEETLPAKIPGRRSSRADQFKTNPTQLPSSTSPSKHRTPSKPLPTTYHSLQQTSHTDNSAAQVHPVPHIPSWISALVQRLCTDIFPPNAAPHVIAGVETVLTNEASHLPNDARLPVKRKKDKLPALVIAMCFFIMIRVTGRKGGPAECREKERQAVEVVNRSRSDGDGWGREDQEAIQVQDIDAWMVEIKSRGWLRMEWFEKIPDGRTPPPPLPSSSSPQLQQEEDHDSSAAEEDEIGHMEDESESESGRESENGELLTASMARRRDGAHKTRRKTGEKEEDEEQDAWKREVVQSGLGTMVSRKLSSLSSTWSRDGRRIPLFPPLFGL